MSTQIFINPNECKPEFTKIAAHSFFMGPSIGIGRPDPILYYGGNYREIQQATWSFPVYDYQNSSLAPEVKIQDKTAGIPIPINLIPDDIITFSGTAFFNNPGFYISEGFDVTFKIGVFHFDCTNQEILTPAFTFIPVESFLYESGQVCFETSVTLGSNFDIHETRLLVGFVVDVSCPDGTCGIPTPETENLVTVSYTLDIERPCAVITSESNFIIRNCCEPIITELVNIPGLTVGSFHVDDEGNCWEVISASNDVTNFTRNFVDTYTSCVECQAANPCPLNLKIESCCVVGQEFVTGSLPGLEVGDTFVDNNGLCWSVQDTTGGPISEESITVDTIITGNCEDCITANPCPDFWRVFSCCSQLIEVIATTIPLSSGDSFVDTNGICWFVKQLVQQLPTNYDIIVDTVYTGSEDNCLNCTTDNPCPEEYFLTVRNCCDNDRIEVVSVPATYMVYPEGLIIKDRWNVCWEVMSYDTTGAATYLFFDFIGAIDGPKIYEKCEQCRGRFPGICQVYEIQYCDSATTTLIVAQGGSLVIGEVYDSVNGCLEVIGYGYPPNFSLLPIVPVASGITFGDCTSCPAT